MLLSITSLLALALPAQDAPSPAWLGAWSTVEGPRQVLWFEHERAGWLRHNRPSFYRMQAEDSSLSLESWGRFTQLALHFDEDGRLHVEGDDVDLVLERCEVPAALRVAPYPWPTDIEIDADTRAELAIELAHRREEDQRVRRFDGRPSQEEMSEMLRVDEDNVEFLLQVVEELGWIDAERFGRETADAAFLIVQHSPDLRLMRSALPWIEADVRAGRLGGQSYALLYDRFQLNLGGLQRYGSQIGGSAEYGSVLMPCEDLDGVDARRAEMGMGPLADYLDLFRDGPEGPAPRHLTDLVRANDWTPLFNGRDLDGWRVKITGYDLDDNFGDTFRVEEGNLRVSYDQYEQFEGRFGHLIYATPFSHYRLRIEYRFIGEQCPGGPGWAFRNSGVMLHGQAPESMAKDQEFPVSIEAQMLGGSGQGERPTANLCTPGTHVEMEGEVVRRHCTNSSSKTFHGDGWVTLEIEVHGNETIRHFIEGDVVLGYEKPQLDEGDGDAARLLAAGAEAQLTQGYLSLQAESHPIEFRRVEIRELD